MALTALYHRIWARLERNDRYAALDAMAEFSAQAEPAGRPGVHWNLLQHQAFWALTEGRLSEAERASAEAAALARQGRAPQLAAFCRVLQRGTVRWLAGTLADTDPVSVANTPALAFLDLLPATRAALDTLSGRHDQARAQLETLVGGLEGSPGT